MSMFIAWIVVVVTRVFTYFQTHQILYIKIIQFFFVYKLYLNKVWGEKRENACLEMCLAHSKHSLILTIIIPGPRKQCPIHGRYSINMCQMSE